MYIIPFLIGLVKLDLLLVNFRPKFGTPLALEIKFEFLGHRLTELQHCKFKKGGQKLIRIICGSPGQKTNISPK